MPLSTIHYELKDSEGLVLDSTLDGEPMDYLHGHSQILDALEDKLDGLATGDELEVHIKSDEAFGQRDPELIETVKRSDFDPGEEIEVGKEFSFADDDGDEHIVTVIKLEGEDVTVDANHPLAGKDLDFSVKVLGVREASKEEIEHGHAHGPHGHHHHCANGFSDYFFANLAEERIL